MMRFAVRNSEAFNRADKMRKDGINPSLIFFLNRNPMSNISITKPSIYTNILL